MSNRLAGERGQVGGIEVLPLGLTVFVGAMLVVANVWGVVDARMAVSSAAREAARAYVESSDPQGAREAAVAAATRVIRSYGRDPARAVVLEPELAAPYGRCVRVSITVRYQLPVVDPPFVDGLGTLAPVEATHSELIDPFRSGLPGEARC